jgi:hypothetical protein
VLEGITLGLRYLAHYGAFVQQAYYPARITSD